MKNKKLSHKRAAGSVTSVMAALLCILIGLAVGFLVLLAINPAHAWADGFVRILKGGFHDAPYGVGKELANAAPLIMTGLSVASPSRPACSTSVPLVSTRWALTVPSTAPSCSSCPGSSACWLRPFWAVCGVPSRFLQGLLQHQRGHYLHHVQLDRPVPCQ